MFSNIKSKLSYANVAATLALFLALGGGFAVAAGKIGSKDIKPNAVKAKHVKDGQLTGADINEATLAIEGGGAPSGPAGGDLAGAYPNPQLAPNSVGTAEVAEASLTGLDVAANSLTGFNIDEDTLGGGGLVKNCTNGSVHGGIRVDGTDQFGSTFTSAGTQGFSCPAGGPPLARRTAAGVYEVCFPSGALSSSTLNLAIGTAVQTGAGSAGEDNFVTVGTKQDLPTCDNSDGATFEVRVQDIGDAGATLQDGVFVVAAVD